jgi:hypothetical protein
LIRIEECALVQSNLKSLQIPNAVTFVGGYALAHLESLSLKQGNPSFTVDGSILYGDVFLFAVLAPAVR